MIPSNNPLSDEPSVTFRKKPQKKITPQRLKNIALYYLKRFESSTENLRTVLRKRVNAYVRENPAFNQEQAYTWIEEILSDFERLHYLDDDRYTEMKIRNYLHAGKPERYIKNKLKEKGIDEHKIAEILSAQEYDPYDMALQFAKKKKIGPFRPAEQRKEYRQKDMAKLIRAGFDYDIVLSVLDSSDLISDYNLPLQ